MRQLLIIIMLFALDKEVVLDGYGFKVKLVLPNSNYNYSYDNYTEGTIHNFIFTDDSCGMVIQCLANTNTSTINDLMISSDTISIHGYNVVREIGKELDGERMWLKDRYLNLKLEARLRNCSEGALAKYTLVLDNIVLDKQ